MGSDSNSNTLNLSDREFKIRLEQLKKIARIGIWKFIVSDMGFEFDESCLEILRLENRLHAPIVSLFRSLSEGGQQQFIALTNLAIHQETQFDFQCAYQEQSPNPRFLKFIGQSFINDNDSVEIFGILQDVTENVLKEEELKSKRAMDMHLNKLTELGEAAASIAHEINNPLTTIQTSARLLQDRQVKGTLTPEYVFQCVDRIEITSNRIAKIVKGLQSIASSGHDGRKRISTAQMIIDDAVVLCTARIQHADIKIEFDIDPSTRIFGYPLQLSQVILNLINNSYQAIKSLPEKWIRISAKQLDTMTEIRITDSGKDIPSEIQNKFFKYLFTTRNVTEGSGMGLPVCKKIIEGHSGEIIFDKSSLNTSFVIRIPHTNFREEAV